MTFPYTQTHVDMPDAEKDKRGIDEYLIRLSLGVENYEDINTILSSINRKLRLERLYDTFKRDRSDIRLA